MYNGSPETQRKEGDAGEEEAAAARDDTIHGLGGKAVSLVDGHVFTDEERRNIIDQAPRDEFASAAKTPEPKFEKQTPFTD